MTTPPQDTHTDVDYLQSRRTMAVNTWHQFTHTRTRKGALEAARDTWANITAREALNRSLDAAGRAADVWHLLDTRHTRINT